MTQTSWIPGKLRCGWMRLLEATRMPLLPSTPCFSRSRNLPRVAAFRQFRRRSRLAPPLGGGTLVPSDGEDSSVSAQTSPTACDPGPAPTGDCPKGWEGPDSQGCCERHYSASCNEACAKDECAHYKRKCHIVPACCGRRASSLPKLALPALRSSASVYA